MQLESKHFDLILSLDTPEKVANYMDSTISYDNQDNYDEKDLTNKSFIEVLQTKKAHCLEGAIFAAGVMYFNGHTPLIVSLDAPKDHSHNIFVYRDKVTGKIGSLAMSRDPALRHRRAAYNSLQELILSYYSVYTEYLHLLDRITEKDNLIIESDVIFSMRGYSQTINLEDYLKKGIDWICGRENLDIIENDLYKIVYKDVIKDTYYKTPNGIYALKIDKPKDALFELPKIQKPSSLIHLR